MVCHRIDGLEINAVFAILVNCVCHRIDGLEKKTL